jgi:predicted transcriptional regulator
MPTMPDLSDTELAALRFMAEKPLRIHALSAVPNVEEVAAMLDRLAGMGLCRRTLEGLNRVYSITPQGAEIVAKPASRTN